MVVAAVPGAGTMKPIRSDNRVLHLIREISIEDGNRAWFIVVERYRMDVPTENVRPKATDRHA